MLKGPGILQLPRRMIHRSLASWGAFALSGLVHLSALLLVGGYVVYQGVVPKAPFAEVPSVLVDAPDAEVMPEPEETTGLPDAPTLPIESPLAGETTAPEMAEASHDMIVSTATNPAFILPPAAGGPVGRMGLGSSSAGGTAAGAAGGGGGGEARAAVRQLFGTRVETRSMGVIVDAFASMSPYMPEVMNELERQFPEASVFFMQGCGLTVGQAAAVPVRMTSDNWTSTDFANQKSKVVNMESRWIRSLVSKGRAFTFQKADSSHRDTIAAFDTMIAEGVDTIYWFSDFTDNYNPEVVESLAKKLRQKGIRVHLHHPAGLMETFASSGYDEANPDHSTRARRGVEILEKHFVKRLSDGSGMIPKVLIKGGDK